MGGHKINRFRNTDLDQILFLFVCRWAEQQTGRCKHTEWGFWDRDEGPLPYSAGPHRHPDGPLSCCVCRRFLASLQVRDTLEYSAADSSAVVPAQPAVQTWNTGKHRQR